MSDARPAQSNLSGPEGYALLREAVAAVLWSSNRTVQYEGSKYRMIPDDLIDALSKCYANAPILPPVEVVS